MEARFDESGSKLELIFSETTSVEAFLSEVRSSGGFVARLECELRQFDVLEVWVGWSGESHRAFEASVAQVFPSGGDGAQTAFLVDDWKPAAERVLRNRLTGSSSVPEAEGETFGTAAIHQIKQLNPNERARLANRGGRPERQVLLRDNSPMVLQALLTNPQIEGKEILQIVKSTYATGAILQRVAGDARWGKNQEILAAVVRNPKTPPLVASRLVDKLRLSDLRILGKTSSGVREAIRKAALREYLRRSGR